MKAIYDKTTARGDVYRAQIVGFLDDVDVSARAEVVVDGTTEPPRQVFYKDLSMNGKGFSDAILLGGSAVESVDPFGGGGEWGALDQATSDIFEIETPGSADDPFAELDRQTGYRFDAPSVPNATANPNAPTNADPLGAGLETSATGANELASTPQTLEENDPLVVPVGEIGAETASPTDGPASETAASAAPKSRREQLLNALQTMRSSRLRGASGESTDGGAASDVGTGDLATPPSSETETPVDAGAFGALEPSASGGRGGATGGANGGGGRTNGRGGASGGANGGGGRTNGRGGASETPPF